MPVCSADSKTVLYADADSKIREGRESMAASRSSFREYANVRALYSFTGWKDCGDDHESRR